MKVFGLFFGAVFLLVSVPLRGIGDESTLRFHRFGGV
jgi:hypothetical protein